MDDLNFILASASPRRKELLSWTGLLFSTRPVDTNETPREDELPSAYVARLAQEKATLAAQQNHAVWVLGSDTTVADGSDILGKPANPAQALEMLHRLSGRVHQVSTALALWHVPSAALTVEVCTSFVPMRKFSEAEIISYVASGDPMDKAGAYGIQNRDFHPVENFLGCFANVMGFPLCHFARLCKNLNISLPVDIPSSCQAHLQYSCPVFSNILSGQRVG